MKHRSSLNPKSLAVSIGLAAALLASYLGTRHYESIQIYWHLGTLPRLSVEGLVEENDEGDVYIWVQLSLLNTGGSDLFYYGWGEDAPLLVHEGRSEEGEWESVDGGVCGTGIGIRKLPPGATIDFSTILDEDYRSQKFGVQLGRSELDEGIIVYSRVVDATEP